MTDDEIRIRSTYLFLACSQAIERFAVRLSSTLPEPPSAVKPLWEKSLKKELGLLFRYWTTRQIWEHLEGEEAAAKALNLALLRLFTDAFRLPKDGSGLRYAEFSTLAEEVQELGHRITNDLGLQHPPLLAELRTATLPWRDAVAAYTADALERPLDQLAANVKAWVERP